MNKINRTTTTRHMSTKHKNKILVCQTVNISIARWSAVAKYSILDLVTLFYIGSKYPYILLVQALLYYIIVYFH